MHKHDSLKRPLPLEHQIFPAKQRRYDHPLLLLHGAWHGAWCWHQAAQDLSERGFEVHCMSLRAHGASASASWLSCSLEGYLEDLKRIMLSIEPRPIVVGHSLGGFVVQHYLEQEQLAGAVLLCALPATHFPLTMLRFFLRNPKGILRTLLSWDSRHLLNTEQRVRAAFFRSESEQQLVQHTLQQLVPESLRIFVDTLFRRVKTSTQQTPIAVIAAQADAIFPVSEQQRLAAHYHTQAHIIPNAAHDLMLDAAWPQAADLLEHYARLWQNSYQDAQR